MTTERSDELADLTANPQLARLAGLLSAAPSERELAGLDAAIHGFRAAHVSDPSHPLRRRLSMLTSLAGAKLGATIAAAAIGLTGAATVAYVTTSTPATPNAHATVAASPTHPTAAPTTAGDASEHASSTGSPVGPDASGPAAVGLCTAWRAGIADHGKAMDSVAFQNLVAAAGGEDKVGDYCDTVTPPGQSGEHAANQATERPTQATVPTQRPTATHPAATGEPSDVPTPEATHPTGRS